MKHLIVLTLASVFLPACSRSDAEQSASNSDQQLAEGAVGAEEPIKGEASSKYQPGQMLRTLRDAPCVEDGAKASDKPWNVKSGSYVTWLADKGESVRVETAPGLACTMAADAVGPS